jgi:hypothetical protein
MRRHLLVQKAVTIDAVDRVSAQSSFFDERLDRVDEIEAFVLQIIRGGGGKHQQRRPRVTIRDEGHFHVQVGAVPGCCAAFHKAGDIVADFRRAQVWTTSETFWANLT